MSIEEQGAMFSLSSFITSFLPSARADEPQSENDGDDDSKADRDAGSKDAGSKGSDDAGKDEDGETEAGGEGEEEEEESGGAGGDDEDEEEEPEDEYPTIREKCADSKDCANLKHHFEHCQEKVNAGKGHKGEDCVEELFHLMHCVDNCAAPKIFAKLR